MKNSLLIIFLQLIVLLTIITFFVLFAIGMSCPSCTEPNLAYPAEIIISIGIIIYSISILLFYKKIADKNRDLIMLLSVLFGLIFIFGSIPQNFWLSKYYFNDSIRGISRSVAYPWFGIMNIILSIALFFSDLKFKYLSKILIIIPRLINGIIYSVVHTELFLTLFFIVLFEIIYNIWYSVKLNKEL